MGYNNDWAANNYCYLKRGAGDPVDARYVRIMTLGKFREGGINDRQVAVCYGVATSLAHPGPRCGPLGQQGRRRSTCGTRSWSGARPRACRDRLPREGGRDHRFQRWAAGSFGITDAREAWVVELLGGHHWVAARVPDNAFYAQPNMLRIRQIDL